YRDVFEAAAAGVTGIYPSQHPQLEGAIDREIFGILDRKPMRFIQVTGRDGDAVTLGSGAAQGVAVGSRWGVYPAGSLEPTPDDRLGSLVVSAVQAVTATATVDTTEGVPDKVTAPARAVREGQDLATSRLRVELPPGDLAELAATIEESTLLELVDPGLPTDAGVVNLPP